MINARTISLAPALLIGRIINRRGSAQSARTRSIEDFPILERAHTARARSPVHRENQ
jgi:hypothetical protein